MDIQRFQAIFIYSRSVCEFSKTLDFSGFVGLGDFALATPRIQSPCKVLADKHPPRPKPHELETVPAACMELLGRATPSFAWGKSCAEGSASNATSNCRSAAWMNSYDRSKLY